MSKTRSGRVYQEIHEPNIVFDVRESADPDTLSRHDRRVLAAKKRKKKKVRH